jgi:hypothetical protein
MRRPAPRALGKCACTAGRLWDGPRALAGVYVTLNFEEFKVWAASI